jgi:EAL domain-containing protein (putative c-di-GMP-specific phosphodiesterase class I)
MSELSYKALFAYFARNESGESTAGDNIARRKSQRMLRSLAPYLSGIGATALVCVVLAAIYFTWLDWQWITFFAGILISAVLSLASRSIRAEWLIARRTAQLAHARQTLVIESRLRARAEHDLAGFEKNTTYLHESLPAMLACVDAQHQLKYHNRAFMHGLGNGGSLDGRHLREAVGSVVYGELESDLACAFGGAVAHRECQHQSTTGESFRLLMQCLPQFTDSGEVAGVFLLSTDITIAHDFVVQPVAVPPVDLALRTAAVVAETAAERGDDIARLCNALARDEFCLFFQTIEPLGAKGVAVPFHEILLRLKAEEEGMMPPGSFFPAAEEHGMLPDLDRWVVRHLLGWTRINPIRQQAVYSVNIAAQTLADPEFPAFVKRALRDFGLPGSLLCFELKETDVLNRTADANRFIGELKPEGCTHAICGFSGNRASFDLLRQVPVNFLKIDGGLILNIGRSAVDLARVKAIHRVAQTIGISTVAECVEDDKTLRELRAIGVDFAQGFGISLPRDLRSIVSGVAVEMGSDSVVDRVAMAGD